VEVLSNPFVSPAVHDDFGLLADDPRRVAIRLANPLSDEQPELRTSLLATLLPVLRRNISRGSRDIGLFELGSVNPTDVAGSGQCADPSVDGRPSRGRAGRGRGRVPAAGRSGSPWR